MTLISPSSTIGIMGGGQLGRMLAIAAAEMGYRTHIFTPEADSPAAQVANITTVAAYTDQYALARFAASVQVVTFEFENIPHASLELLASKLPVRPKPAILQLSQHRLREKFFLKDNGIATTNFMRITNPGELLLSMLMVGTPAVLKTAEMGYDGKGQVRLDIGSDPDLAWKTLNTQEAILEAFVDFRMEISVIVARDVQGVMQSYAPVENRHKNHILDTTIAPAPITAELSAEAQAIAQKIAGAMDLVGVMAVEMFVTKDDRILVNELAPRPHNSGHWTIDAAVTSQFEQQVRAVCGLPLGSPDKLCDAEMKNLIGDDAHEWQQYLHNPRAKLHLYGKKEPRPGRKMGHVTILKD